MLDKFKLGGTHCIKGCFKTREEILEFKDSNFKKIMNKEGFENFFIENEDNQLLLTFLTSALSGIDKIKDRVNEELTTFFNDHYNQKKINSEKLLNLPFVDGYYELKISNINAVAKLSDQLELQDVKVVESTMMNFGSLFFDSKFRLSFVRLTEGVSCPEPFIDYLNENLKQLGFEILESSNSVGSVAYQGDFIPKRNLIFDADFVRSFHTYSIIRNELFFLNDTSVKSFYQVGDSSEIRNELHEEYKEKYNIKLTSLKIRELMTGGDISYEETEKPLYNLRTSSLTKDFITKLEGKGKNLPLYLHEVLIVMDKYKLKRLNYELYIENILRNYKLQF